MRKCIRCETEMVEGCDIHQEVSLYGLSVSNSTNLIFKRSLGKPLVAICPKCGEISMYIKDVSKLEEKA